MAVLCEALLPSEERSTSALARAATLDTAFRLVIETRRAGTVLASLEGIVDQGTGKHAIPSDPFTGDPLRMRSDERGIVIWSIGPNGKDDGGRIQEEAPGTDDLRTILLLP